MRTLLVRVLVVIAVLLDLPVLISWVAWRWLTGRLHNATTQPVPQHDLIEPVGISAHDR